MPAFLLTVIFRYIPMGGTHRIHGLQSLKGFLRQANGSVPSTLSASSPPRTSWSTWPTPQAQRFGLLWGFPPHPPGFPAQPHPEQDRKQKIQLVLYMPNWVISVIVLAVSCASSCLPPGMVNMLMGTSYNFMTCPRPSAPSTSPAALAAARLGGHHLHRGPVQRQQDLKEAAVLDGPTSSSRSGGGVARHQDNGADPVHHVRGQHHERGLREGLRLQT